MGRTSTRSSQCNLTNSSRVLRQGGGFGMPYARYIRCVALSLWILYLPKPLWSQEPPKPNTSQAAADPAAPAQPATEPGHAGEEQGARLHWRQVPKNILMDQKTIFTIP